MSYDYELGVRFSRRPSAQALGGLTDSVVDAVLSGKIIDLEVRLAKFNAMWAGSKLTDASLPTGFVIDLLGALLREVIQPFTDLRLEMLRNISNVVVTDAILTAGKALETSWNKRLMPVMLDAIQKRAAGLQTMAVVIPSAPPGYTMARHVNMVILTIIGGYQTLMELNEAKPWYMRMGGVTAGALNYLEMAGAMVDQAVKVMAAAGAIIYKPIAAVITATEWAIKGTLAAGALYLAWKFFK